MPDSRMTAIVQSPCMLSTLSLSEITPANARTGEVHIETLHALRERFTLAQRFMQDARAGE